jgi:hypothetical protein
MNGSRKCCHPEIELKEIAFLKFCTNMLKASSRILLETAADALLAMKKRPDHSLGRITD